MPPEWLTGTIPRKTPFVPQMGDEVMYFRQGHELYLQAVERHKSYEISSNICLPWQKNPHLRVGPGTRKLLFLLCVSSWSEAKFLSNSWIWRSVSCEEMEFKVSFWYNEKRKKKRESLDFRGKFSSWSTISGYSLSIPQPPRQPSG